MYLGIFTHHSVNEFMLRPFKIQNMINTLMLILDALRTVVILKRYSHFLLGVVN